MKYLFSLSYLLFFLLGFGQVPGFENLNYSDSTYVDFSGMYDSQSTSIRNEITAKLFRGGEITSADKQSLLDQHKKFNRLGREMKGDFLFSNLTSSFLGSKKYAWVFNLGYHSVFSGHYSKELLSLALNGNAGVLGDTVDFGSSTFNQMTYQYLGAGFQDKKTKSFLTLNIVNLQSYFYGNLAGELYTSSDSSEIYLKAKADFETSYRSKINNGLGVGINFTLNMQVPIFETRNICFQLKVVDFGVARISPISTQKVDTSITYKGFEISDLLDLQQLSLEKEDWTDTLNIHMDTVSKWTMLPVMLQFSKILLVDSSARFQTFFGVKSYPTISYFPKIFAGVDLKLTPKIYSGISLSYGGFGGFRAGIYGRLQLKKLQLYLGAEDIYGLVSRNGFGQNLNLRLLCNL